MRITHILALVFFMVTLFINSKIIFANQTVGKQISANAKLLKNGSYQIDDYVCDPTSEPRASDCELKLCAVDLICNNAKASVDLIMSSECNFIGKTCPSTLECLKQSNLETPVNVKDSEKIKPKKTIGI
jgi:hypothetical protein